MWRIGQYEHSSEFRTVIIRFCRQGKEDRYELANFVTRISKIIVISDGVNETTNYILAGKCSNGDTLPDLEVSAEQFYGMNWLSRLPLPCVIAPGFANRDHLRTAIQLLSGKPQRHETYIHSGWRRTNFGHWIYLSHQSVVPDTSVKSISADLSEGGLEDISLPASPLDEQEIRECVSDSLALLDLGPEHIVYALLAAIYRAPLCEIVPADFSVFLVGRTGSQKTSLAGLAQAHFGQKFSERNLLDSFLSTRNSIERRMFLAKDCLYCADDYLPGVISDVLADQIFRSQGNKAGRVRMRADGHSIRLPNRPRCLLLSTGEDIPKGHSLRARLLVVEIESGDIDLQRLTELQQFMREGRLARAMSCFLRWLSTRLDSLEGSLKSRIEDLRDRICSPSMHARTPDIVASLYVGLEIFLEFALESGVITSLERDALLAEGLDALVHNALVQQPDLATEDPAVRFCELIGAAFLSGRAHLLDSHQVQRAPVDSEKWGWRELHPRGECVGWLANDEVWLNPDNAYLVAKKIAGDQGQPLHTTRDTLWKRLVQAGIAARSDGEGRNQVKRWVNGQRMRIIRIVNPQHLSVTAPLAP